MTSLHGASLAADGLGERAGECAELRQHLELVEHALGRLDIHKAGDALGNLVESFDTKRKSHAPFAAELIDQNLVSGMTLDVFEQQRRSAGRVVPFHRRILCASFRIPAPILLTRSVISVISRSGDTSSRMRLSSPCFSSVLIQSRRSS